MLQQIASAINTRKLTGLVKPLDTVITDTIEKTLGSVLSKVTSSHEAVFIFDESGDFMGLVSPYKTLYTNHFPYDTKVETVLMVPPTLTEETLLHEVVTHMLATKIYTLPVFDDSRKIIGVVNGHDIINHIIGDSDVLQKISSAISVQKPVTAPIDSLVGDIYNQLKDTGVSRIILAKDTGAIGGIITRNDLARAFIKPSVKRRYPSEGSVVGFYSRGGEKKFRADYPVRRYATTMVDSLPADSSKTDLVVHLTNSPHNSVVLIDRKFRPTGLVSIRDILRAITPSKADIDSPLTINVPVSDTPEDQLIAGERHLALFWEKLRKRMNIEKINVATGVRKNTAKQPRLYTSTIKVTPVSGEPLIATSEARNYLDSVQAATTLIEKQRKRSGLHAKKSR